MFQLRMGYVTEKFLNAVGLVPLEEHFKVPGKYTFRQLSYDEFDVEVQRNYDVVPRLTLPDDVCRTIASFLNIRMNATFRLKYESAFRSPQWSLQECTTNLKVQFKRPLMIHNTGYMDEWSPAVTMESDILHLILTILPIIHNASK